MIASVFKRILLSCSGVYEFSSETPWHVLAKYGINKDKNG